MKYYISFTETFNKVVCVEAANVQEAKSKAERAYLGEKIILDDSNHLSTEIELEEDRAFWCENDEGYCQRIK